jgi:hypothetical protein
MGLGMIALHSVAKMTVCLHIEYVCIKHTSITGQANDM